MASVIEKRKFVFSTVEDNHNKLYIISLYDNGDVRAEWGRVGANLQQKTFSNAGKRFAETKIAEKLGKGYKEVNIIDSDGIIGSSKVSNNNELKNIAIHQIQHSSPIVAKLIDYLVEKNQHDIHTASGGNITWNKNSGLFTTPLGILHPADITRARDILGQIAPFVERQDYSNRSFISNLEEYLTLVPQNIGNKYIPKNILPDSNSIQKQNSILDALEASYVSVTTAKSDKDDSKKNDSPKIFDVSLSLIEDSNIVKSIFDNIIHSIKGNHSCSYLRPKKLYEVSIPSMKRAFEEVKSLGNIKDLYHGSRSYNLLSILRQGLVIPPCNSSFVTGRLFGNGLYFASSSSKSLNYSYGYWDRSGRDENCFVFIAEVALGKSYTPRNTYENLPKPRFDSTWAKANISGVLNDEFIVYKTNQCNLKYLVEFSK